MWVKRMESGTAEDKPVKKYTEAEVVAERARQKEQAEHYGKT